MQADSCSRDPVWLTIQPRTLECNQQVKKSTGLAFGLHELATTNISHETADH